MNFRSSMSGDGQTVLDVNVGGILYTTTMDTLKKVKHYIFTNKNANNKCDSN